MSACLPGESVPILWINPFASAPRLSYSHQIPDTDSVPAGSRHRDFEVAGCGIHNGQCVTDRDRRIDRMTAVLQNIGSHRRSQMLRRYDHAMLSRGRSHGS